MLREFYIGSCDFSVDCSLRGGDDEHSFDHSADLGDGNLGDSVELALEDLQQEIDSTEPKNMSVLQNGFLKGIVDE